MSIKKKETWKKNHCYNPKLYLQAILALAYNVSQKVKHPGTGYLAKSVRVLPLGCIKG